jgi:hypothetical protein
MSNITDGVYYPDGEKPQVVQMNSMYKAWNMDEQRRTHAADILQTHKGGAPNGEFIRQYPEEATRMFTPDQIERYGNEY